MATTIGKKCLTEGCLRVGFFDLGGFCSVDHREDHFSAIGAGDVREHEFFSKLLNNPEYVFHVLHEYPCMRRND